VFCLTNVGLRKFATDVTEVLMDMIGPPGACSTSRSIDLVLHALGQSSQLVTRARIAETYTSLFAISGSTDKQRNIQSKK